jgi:signal transduction histidine kinase
MKIRIGLLLALLSGFALQAQTVSNKLNLKLSLNNGFKFKLTNLFYQCVIISCLFIPIRLNGQNYSKIDSLKRKLEFLELQKQSFANDTLQIRILYSLRNTYYSLSDSSNFYQIKLKKIAKRISWPVGKFYIALTTALNLTAKGQYYEAIEEYYRSLKIAEETGRKDLRGLSLRFLSDCFYTLKAYDKSVYYLRKASILLNSKNTYFQYLMCLNNMGMAYIELNKLELAEEILMDCLIKNKKSKTNDKFIETYCHEQLANLYQRNNVFYKAEKHLIKSMEIRKELKTGELYELYPKLTEIYLLKNEIKKAKQFADSSIKYSEKLQSFYKAQAYEVNYKIYKRLRQSDESLYYHEKYVTLKDSNERNNIKKIIDGMYFEFENKKHQTDIRNLQLSLESEKNARLILVSSLFMFFVMLAILYYLYRKTNIQKVKIELIGQKLKMLNEDLENKVQSRTIELISKNEELVKKNQEIQEAYFTGKIYERKRVASELHDNLGSTITGLLWQIDAINTDNFSEREKKIYAALVIRMKEVYAEIRYISHNLVPDELNIGFTMALKKLLDDLNSNEKMKFILTGYFPKDFVSKTDELEIYSITLELINNLLKHSRASFCHILLDSTSEEWIITQKDDGIGFNINEVRIKSLGRGLKNIEERVKSIGGSLKIHSSIGHGSTFRLSVPKQYF